MIEFLAVVGAGTIFGGIVFAVLVLTGYIDIEVDDE